jgi:hypothetical protein
MTEPQTLSRQMREQIGLSRLREYERYLILATGTTCSWDVSRISGSLSLHLTMTSDVPGGMPSTIIAPDLSLSTMDTEIEIERSFPWTPARISRSVGLVSPGANTIASGQSAVLPHVPMAPLFPGRPRNPSPPSLPGSMGGGDTPTLQQQQKEEQINESFLPELSERLRYSRSVGRMRR